MVVYTTGRAVALPTSWHQAPLIDAAPSGVNLVDGGSISITAKRNVTGSGGYAAINDWLRRTSVISGWHPRRPPPTLLVWPICPPTGG